MDGNEDESRRSGGEPRSAAFLAFAFLALFILGVVGFFVMLGLSGAGPAVTGGGDDPLVDIRGLGDAEVLIEATVLENRGPEVTPLDGDLIEFDFDEGFPSVLVEMRLVHRLDREEVSEELLELLAAALDNGSNIELTHSNSFLETGREYALFVRESGLGMPVVSFAVDIETERPAHGLLQNFDDIIQPALVSAWAEVDGGTTSDGLMLIALANGYAVGDGVHPTPDLRTRDEALAVEFFSILAER